MSRSATRLCKPIDRYMWKYTKDQPCCGNMPPKESTKWWPQITRHTVTYKEEEEVEEKKSYSGVTRIAYLPCHRVSGLRSHLRISTLRGRGEGGGGRSYIAVSRASTGSQSRSVGCPITFHMSNLCDVFNCPSHVLLIHSKQTRKWVGQHNRASQRCFQPNQHSLMGIGHGVVFITSPWFSPSKKTKAGPESDGWVKDGMRLTFHSS